MSLKGKYIGILVEQDYQDQEVWYPKYRLTEAEAEVVFVGPKAGQTIPSKFGYPAVMDMSVEAALDSEFDGLVIPGGWAPDFMRRDPNFARLVRNVHNKGGIIASICHGGWMLVSADILRGRTATSFMAIQDDMKAAGCNWVDEEVVRDGNLITSRKPDDLPAFVKTFMQALEE